MNLYWLLFIYQCIEELEIMIKGEPSVFNFKMDL